MSNKKKSRKGFFLGALVGAALGILFAPAKGSDTRKSLGKKIDELIKRVSSIDIEEIKEAFDDKIEAIQIELESLDGEKVMKIAKEKGEQLKRKAEDLLQFAKEKGTPLIEEAAKDVLEKVVAVSTETIKKLEKKQKLEKEETE
ncbi:MAG: YtxH domain-containing protein [Bacilli bacterium]|jgi:gas vesicle protein